MEYLFSIRHGVYGHDNRLNSKGRSQIQESAKKMQEKLDGKSVHIISSTAQQAIDSAKIIAEVFGVKDIQEEHYLGNSNNKDNYCRNPNNDRLFQIINQQEDKAEGIIVVSHSGVAETLLEYYFWKQEGYGCPIRKLGYGDYMFYKKK